MRFEGWAPRWRAAAGFGLGGIMLVLPPLLAWLQLPPWGMNLGNIGLSLTMIGAVAAFGLFGLLAAVGVGLSRLLIITWTAIFLTVVPLQWGLTYLLAPGLVEGYPDWFAWTLMAIPQIFALGIAGTAAGFVAGGRPMATWGGRALALSGFVLYLALLANNWLGPELAAAWPKLIIERFAALAAGGWLYGYGMETVARDERELAVEKAVRQ